VFTPEEIDPIDVQTRNGVVNVAVQGEAEAVAVVRTLLGYFQGQAGTGRPVDTW
jgi:acetyl-CoA carboxylase carboxyltransferase component